jgi:2-polyprenyl-6-methoxyphenol hydroxylase-like FAD-dependent oxidoreductase
MQRLNVLISGAGIAGMTLAYWLTRYGMRVTVVELAAGQRSSGSPIDVRAQAADIADRMGIMARVRNAVTNVTGMRFIDARGRVAARVDTIGLQRASGRQDVEIPRGDLAAILQEASRDSAEVLFNDAIRSLTQDSGGAEGLHSGVRRHVFGPELDFVHHAGLYVATLPLSRSFDGIDRHITMFNAPRRSATIHPARSRPLAAFIFWHDPPAGFDHRDVEQQRRLVADTYRGDGWHLPALLKEMQTTDDLYFDSVSRVHIASWAQGRVVLVGDAASCVSLLGDGSSLAMIGAHTLAEALARHNGDHALAFREYEAQHRRLVEPKQRSMRLGASLLVPRTSTGIAMRNTALRLAPLFTAAQWVRRRAASSSTPAAVSNLDT